MTNEELKEMCVKIISNTPPEVSMLNGKRITSIPDMKWSMIEQIEAIQIPTDKESLIVEKLKQLINDDGYAASFQSLSQYRSALLKLFKD